MVAVGVLHMNAGDGKTSYANNSSCRFRKIFGIISGIYTWQSRALTVYKSLLRAIPERFVTVSQLRIRRISAWRMYVSYSPWEEHCYYRLELLTISLL
ncbi:hypothetical protein WN943_020084 [Citrus x changshan-huyou]